MSTVFVQNPTSNHTVPFFLSLHLQKPKKCEFLGQNLRFKSSKQVSTLIKHQRTGNVPSKLIPFSWFSATYVIFFPVGDRVERELTHASCKCYV